LAVRGHPCPQRQGEQDRPREDGPGVGTQPRADPFSIHRDVTSVSP